MQRTRPARTPRSLSPTTATIYCVECRRPWIDEAERWRLKVMDGRPPETVPYCPDCATREFGPARARH